MGCCASRTGIIKVHHIFANLIASPTESRATTTSCPQEECTSSSVLIDTTSQSNHSSCNRSSTSQHSSASSVEEDDTTANRTPRNDEKKVVPAVPLRATTPLIECSAFEALSEVSELIIGGDYATTVLGNTDDVVNVSGSVLSTITFQRNRMPVDRVLDFGELSPLSDEDDKADVPSLCSRVSPLRPPLYLTSTNNSISNQPEMATFSAEEMQQRCDTWRVHSRRAFLSSPLYQALSNWKNDVDEEYLLLVGGGGTTTERPLQEWIEICARFLGSVVHGVLLRIVKRRMMEDLTRNFGHSGWEVAAAVFHHELVYKAMEARTFLSVVAGRLQIRFEKVLPNLFLLECASSFLNGPVVIRMEQLLRLVDVGTEERGKEKVLVRALLALRRLLDPMPSLMLCTT